MERGYGKEDKNSYYQARKRASVVDARLRSQEGASELLNISADSLANYESGRTKRVPVDVIVAMAKLYNSPELITEHCMNECPIHGFLPLATRENGIQGIALRMILMFDSEELSAILRTMCEIAEDGEIKSEDIPKIQEILAKLEDFAEIISEVKITTMKRIERRSE